MDSMVPLSSLAIMVVGAHRAAAGAVTVGDVVSAIYLLALLAVPIRGIGWVLGQMPSALVSFQRVSRISAAATEVDEPGHLTLPREGAGRLGFRGAHVGADDGDGNPVVIVRDVTLDLAPGTVTALVGATGAGKTTVALAAARLSRAIEGEVILDDSNIEVIESLGSSRGARAANVVRVCGHGARQRDARRRLSDEAVWLALKRAAIADVVRGFTSMATRSRRSSRSGG